MKKNIFLINLLSLVFGFSVQAQEGLFAGLSQKYENVKVVRVIKTDLIELDNGKRVRLIGLKVGDKFRPKVRVQNEYDAHGFIIEKEIDPTSSVQDQAYNYMDGLLLREKVRVELDSQSADEDGHTWGYVFLLDGSMVNDMILRQGFAELQIRPQNMKYAEQLRGAYKEARQEKRGIHSE